MKKQAYICPHTQIWRTTNIVYMQCRLDVQSIYLCIHPAIHGFYCITCGFATEVAIVLVVVMVVAVVVIVVIVVAVAAAAVVGGCVLLVVMFAAARQTAVRFAAHFCQHLRCAGDISSPFTQTRNPSNKFAHCRILKVLVGIYIYIYGGFLK